MNSVLHGGRRRRRARRRLAALALAGALLLMAAAAYLGLDRHDEPAGARPGPVVSGATRAPRVVAAEPEHSRPLEPPPAAAVSLSRLDAFSMRFRRPPRAGMVFDVGSGEVLWRRRALRRLPIASLTKIMTALLVTERARPRERVRISRTALRYRGSGVGVLPRGKRVRLEALLNGLLLVSGNDAAIALAEHVAGSEGRFVALMNRRARRLGLRCTRFADSYGLSPRNRSCPRDLAVLSRIAMGNRRIARVVRRREASFRFPIKGGRLFLYAHNPLLRMRYRGTIGLKTGYTGEAGRCFIGVARRRRRTLAVILLDSPDPSRQAPRLLNAGFLRG